MPTIAESFAAFKAQREASPEQPKEDNASQGAGDVASAFQRFQQTRARPDMAKEWSASKGGTFQRSLDADTLDLSRGKNRQSTRLAGIDAPESSQALGPEGQKYLDDMIAANPGKVRIGSKMKDRHGRDVSILYAGDKNLNLELVKNGYAKVYPAYIQTLSKEMQQELLDAQDSAKTNKKGVWSADYVAEDPEAYRRRMGSQNMAKGHDMRAPIDQSTKTVAQAFQEYKASGGRSGVARLNDSFQEFKSNRDFDQVAQVGMRNKDKYTKEEGWLDHVFGALDYMGNISRSAIKGAIEGGESKAETALTYARQARDKIRHTDSTNLKDTATQAAGLGKLRMGVDDGKFSVGDLGDYATDLAVDIFTDPLTFVTMGFGSVAQGGGKLAKTLPAIHQGAVDAKLGIKSANAIKFAKAQMATRAAIGATYGVGATDGDADLSTKLLAAGAGAALGAGSGKGFDKASALFKTGFNKASDWYAVTTRGSKFADFSKARNVALQSYDKVRNIAEWISQGRFQAIKELTDPVDKIRATELMQTLKTEFLRRRKLLEEKVLQIDPGHPAYPRIMNNFNRRIERNIEETFLPALLEKEKKDVADAVVAWGNHNTNVIRKLNREAFGLEHGVPTKEGKGIVGIKWHIDDVYEKSNFKEAENLLGQAQIHKAEALKRSDSSFKIAMDEYAKQTGKKLTSAEAKELMGKDQLLTKLMSDATDKSYKVYAETFSKKFLDKTEQDASKLMMEFADTAAKQRGVRQLETMLTGLDKVTNFAKANMLYFSMSWLKNNYFDNLAKSYLESGVNGFMDAASFGKLRKGVSEDVLDLYKNKMNRVYKNEDIQDALGRGVLDNPMFKSLSDKGTRAFLYTPDEIKAATAKSPVAFLKKLPEMWLSNPYVRMVGQMGSHMEGTARMMTYIRAKEALLSSPLFKNGSAKEAAMAKDIAADLVKKTFFDYGDVTHFENAVFKRLIPFYSFYSKNLPYWVKSAFDPEKTGRLLALEKARRNVGTDPSSHDKEGMTPYLLNNAARKIGKNDRGDTEYGIFPSGSLYDAIKMMNPGEWKEQAIEKGHPHLKAIYELSSGNDLFDGQKLFPSDSKDGKKFLFSRGFKYKALGIPGVDVDDRGNPYATSDKVVAADKVLSTLFPHGLIDQVAGSAGKVTSGKETLGEALRNRLSPMQTAKVSEAYARMIRQRKNKEGDDK